MTVKILVFLVVIIGAYSENITFKNITISTYFKHLMSVNESSSLKHSLPKENLPSAIITGDVPILYKNSVADIDNVEKIVFFKNGIEKIEPEAIRNLSGVESLTLAHQKLNHLDKHYFNNLNIKLLQVSYSTVVKLDENSLGNLPELLTLNLFKMKLKQLDVNTFKHLTTLNTLSLTDNELTSLPIGIFKTLTNLTEVYLAHNQISILDKNVFVNTKIATLDLSNNSISTLPEDFFNTLSNLTRIILSINNLTTISKGIFTNNTHLRQIELNRNNISFIDPEAFDNMASLTNIILSSNKLKQYDPNWFLNTPNIYRLFLDYNSIEELPIEAFKNIYNQKKQWITLESNKIKEITPQIFKGFKKINNLNLAHNELESWNEENLQDAEVLDYLNLLYNKITCFSGSFDRIFLANITYLHGNPLTEECVVRIKEWTSGQNISNIIDLD